MTMEEQLIKNVENGIRGIRLGTKTAATANVGPSLNRLKAINEGMYQELLKKYVDCLNERKTE